MRGWSVDRSKERPIEYLRDMALVHAVLTTEVTRCLRKECGSKNIKANGWSKPQEVAHTPLDGRPCRLSYRRHHFYCKDCKKTSRQPVLGIYKGTRMTVRLRRFIARHSQRDDVSFNGLAVDLGLSARTIRNVFRKHSAHRRKLRPREAPKVIGMDGVYIQRQESLIVANLEPNRVVMMKPFIAERPVAAALREMENLDGVEEVVSDMAGGLDRVQREVMPKARRTKDRHHIQREANNAVVAVKRALTPSRKRSKKGGSQICPLYLLRKRKHQLDKGELAQLNWYLGLYPLLKLTYELKEAFCDFWNAPDLETALAKYAEWLEQHARWKAAMPEDLWGAFDKLIGLMDKGKEGVFNYFIARHTTGFVESSNARVKGLTRRAPRASFDTVEAKIVDGILVEQRRRAVQRREKEKRRLARRGKEHVEQHASAPLEVEVAPVEEALQEVEGQAELQTERSEPDPVPAEKKELGPRLDVPRIAALMGGPDGGGRPVHPAKQTSFSFE